jgi:hypothetical protein
MKGSEKRGRPTKPPVPGKRAALGLKVTAQVKRRLDEAAKSNGRTQSQEAELRIEQSFWLDAMFGDTAFADMLRRLAGMTNLIEMRAQRESLDKLLTFRAILAGWSQLIAEEVGPHASPELGQLWDAYERELMRPVREEQRYKAAFEAYRDAEDQLLIEAQNIGHTAARAFSTTKGGEP